MYAIYAYIDSPKPPQLIGIYGSPMECLDVSGIYVPVSEHQLHPETRILKRAACPTGSKSPIFADGSKLHVRLRWVPDGSPIRLQDPPSALTQSTQSTQSTQDL